MTAPGEVRGHLNGFISIHNPEAGTEVWLSPQDQAAYEAWLAEQPRAKGAVI